MLQGIYRLLCVLGFVLPYSQLMPFLLEQGLNIQRFFEQLFINSISSMFGLDVLISSLTFWVFVYWEGRQLQMKHLWVYVVSNLLVGLSLSLPLFLLMRHRQIEQSRHPAKV